MSNPLTNKNAHQHNKNHPHGKDITQIFLWTIDQEKQKNQHSFFSFYAVPMAMRAASKIIGANQFNEISEPTKLAQAQSLIKQDYQDLMQYCLDQQVQLIYVQPDPTAITVQWRFRNDTRLFNPGLTATTWQQQKEFQDVFFSKSLDTWHKLGIVDVWDQRERMALDIRPYNTKRFFLDSDTGFSQPYLRIGSQDLWINTRQVVLDCMRFLDLEPDHARLQSWEPIQHAWSQHQINSVKFYHEVDHIVNAVVNGWFYPIADLDLMHEAIIQHCLIYKHNLNLKTWNLTKFPNNTIDLHQLLEENIHSVDKIY